MTLNRGTGITPTVSEALPKTEGNRTNSDRLRPIVVTCRTVTQGSEFGTLPYRETGVPSMILVTKSSNLGVSYQYSKSRTVHKLSHQKLKP